jgi:hypothetical protein
MPCHLNIILTCLDISRLHTRSHPRLPSTQSPRRAIAGGDTKGRGAYGQAQSSGRLGRLYAREQCRHQGRTGAYDKSHARDKCRARERRCYGSETGDGCRAPGPLSIRRRWLRRCWGTAGWGGGGAGEVKECARCSYFPCTPCSPAP